VCVCVYVVCVHACTCAFDGTNNSLPPSLTALKNDEVKFKAALRKDLNTHSYFVDEFFMCKDNV